MKNIEMIFLLVMSIYTNLTLGYSLIDDTINISSFEYTSYEEVSYNTY